MKYLHVMLRVRNLDDALHFYVDLLGLKGARRRVDLARTAIARGQVSADAS